MGDWDMWLRIAEHYRIGYVPEVLTLYRIHRRNTMYQRQRMLADDLWIHEERIRKRIPELLRRDGWRMRRALGIALAALGVLYSQMGERGKAFEALTQSLKLYPWRLKTWLRLLTSLDSAAGYSHNAVPMTPALARNLDAAIVRTMPATPLSAAISSTMHLAPLPFPCWVRSADSVRLLHGLQQFQHLAV
jgi:tetratricopeptide (TPR) repeat protein